MAISFGESSFVFGPCMIPVFCALPFAPGGADRYRFVAIVRHIRVTAGIQRHAKRISRLRSPPLNYSNGRDISASAGSEDGYRMFFKLTERKGWHAIVTRFFSGDKSLHRTGANTVGVGKFAC
jgi:hypothetical protein